MWKENTRERKHESENERMSERELRGKVWRFPGGWGSHPLPSSTLLPSPPLLSLPTPHALPFPLPCWPRPCPVWCVHVTVSGSKEPTQIGKPDTCMTIGREWNGYPMIFDINFNLKKSCAMTKKNVLKSLHSRNLLSPLSFIDISKQGELAYLCKY